MDRLLIDVARNAYYKAGMYEQKPPCTDDPSISDFQLASFKALLASFLSNPHECPPYLEQGLELFNRGKLETGTELGNFCSRALLSLDVLIHPRQLPPHRGAHSNLGTEQSVLGSGISEPPCSIRKRRGRAINDLGDDCKYRPGFITEEPTDALAKRIAVDKPPTPVELSRVQKDAQWSHDIKGEHSEMGVRYLPTEGVQAIPVSGYSGTNVKVPDGSCRNPAAFDTLGDPPDSFSVYPDPISITTSNSRYGNTEDEISIKKSGYQGSIMSNDASGSQNVPAHTFSVFAAASVSDSEWGLA